MINLNLSNIIHKEQFCVSDFVGFDEIVPKKSLNSWLAHVHVFDVVEDERAGRAVSHHLLVDLVPVGREQRPPVALVQAVRRHGVGLGEIQGDGPFRLFPRFGKY